MNWHGIVVTVCIISAAVLAYTGFAEWYYFLIAGVIIANW